MNPPPTDTPHQGEIWVCYDIPWLDIDLAEKGFVRADSMSAAELRTFSVVNIPIVKKTDMPLRRLLGLDESVE